MRAKRSLARTKPRLGVRVRLSREKRAPLTMIGAPQAAAKLRKMPTRTCRGEGIHRNS
jgi:hypothetical protein